VQAKELMALPRQQAHPTRQDSFLSPRVAEISLLGGLGCGAKLMQVSSDALSPPLPACGWALSGELR
jgi:hypothetical protein